MAEVISPENIENVKVYPVPAYDFVKLDLVAEPDTIVKIRIFDSSDKLMFEREYTVKKHNILITINIKELHYGYYSILISYRDTMIKKKILILK